MVELSTAMSWNILLKAITDLFPVIRLMKLLESEQQITSLIPLATTASNPAFSAFASATKTEATTSHDVEFSIRLEQCKTLYRYCLSYGDYNFGTQVTIFIMQPHIFMCLHYSSNIYIYTYTSLCIYILSSFVFSLSVSMFQKS